MLRPPLGRLPGEVGHLIGGPQILFGMAVAIQTPAHAERLVVHDDRHLVDLAVTTDATDPAPHMNRMVEVNVVRCPMNPHPVNRVATRPTDPKGFELRAVRLDGLVAVHARLGGRDFRDRRILDVRMAVEAGHPQPAGVLLVRERDRLDRRVADARVLGRPVVIQARHAEDSREDHSSDRLGEARRQRAE